jgi:hypothetical protein
MARAQPNAAKTNSMRVTQSHPQGAGQSHRGDRRDTNRVFTNNDHLQPNFSNPAGSGRQQIQAGGKSRKGGGKRQKGTYDH